MADPLTVNKSLAQPVVGSDVGTWGNPVNANTAIIDASFGGVTTIPLTNSNVVLSSAQYQNQFIRLTGVLGANVQLTFPPLGSFYTIVNDTTSSAFYVTMQTTVAGGRVIGMPSGSMIDTIVDGTHARFRNLPSVGTYWDYAGSSTPAWVDACTIPPFLYCNGTSFSSVTYPTLSTLFNGVTLPDFRGRSAFQLNDTSSRLQSSVGGVDGNTIFAAGGNATIALSSTHLPSMTFITSDVGHTHTVTHNANSGGTGPEQSGAAGNIGNFTNSATFTVSSNVTGVSVNSGGSGTPVQLLPPFQVIGIRLVRAA